MHDMKIRRHIGTGTQQIHRCFAVSCMIFKFLYQTTGRHCFPLPRLVQALAVTDDRQAGAQSGRHISLIIASAEQHDLTFHDQLPALFGLFIKILYIRKFSLLIPAHLYPFLLHRLCLYKAEAFPQDTVKRIAKGNLMMIDVVGYKYQL